MGKPLVRFREGQEIQPGYGRDLVAPSRKQAVTEKTNFFLQSRKAPVYSKDHIHLRYFPLKSVNVGKISGHREGLFDPIGNLFRQNNKVIDGQGKQVIDNG